MTLNHHIKQLRVVLSVPDQETANDLQQTVSTFCRTDLDGLLQDTFDAVSPNRWLRIDRLEIDIAAFHSTDEFRSKLDERIREELIARMDDVAAATAVPETVADQKKQTQRSFDRSYHAVDTFIHMLQYGVAPWYSTRANFDEIVLRIIPLLENDPAFRSQLAGLLSVPGPVLRRFILQTPAPARMRIVSLITATDEIRLSEAEKVVETFVKVFTRAGHSVPHNDLLAGQTAICHLIRYQRLDSEVVEAMLKEVTTELLQTLGDEHPQILEELVVTGMELEATLPVRWHEAFRAAMAAFAVHGRDNRHGTGPPPLRALKAPSDRLAQEKAIPDSDTGKPHVGTMPEEMPAFAGQDRRKENHAPEKSPQTCGQRQNDLESRPRTDSPDESESKQAGQIQAAADAKTAQWARSRSLGGITPPKDQSDKVETTNLRKKKLPATGRPIDTMDDRLEQTAVAEWMTPYDAEAFHIHNAGLVLVAPFFRMVFKDLGLLDDEDEFATSQARMRAFHFSQYVVTAKPHPAECDLVLNKIICGMEVDEPVKRFYDLTDREREAAEDVIKSAIGHWTVLKRTSVPIFRQTFLQHDGILTGAGGNWLLRIERISADVLIDTLPWTISIIKHPWMRQPVMVEW